MQEHDAPTARTIPSTETKPEKRARALHHHSALSSPVTWLSLATLIVALIVYLFLAPLPAATQPRPTPPEVPAPR